MKNFTYHDVNEFTVDECKTKISELDEALETAAEAITDLFEYYGLEMSQELKFDMDKIYDKLFDDVKICRDQIAKKAVEVKDEIAVKKNTSCGTTFEDGDGSFQAEKLELLKRKVAAMELANQNAVNECCKRDTEASKLALSKRNAAIKKGVAKYDCIMDEVTLLEEKIRKVHNWSEISDLEVGRYMYEIKDWNDDMQRLLKYNRELEELRTDYALTAEEVKSDSEMVVIGLHDELRLTIDAIKEQDDLRALFTLDKSKSDPVKLPIFEGKESEDYVQFKDKVERAFVINRVCKADQLAKLRECLRCYPLKLVPESTITKIDDAWEVLDQAFKDPTKVMRFKWNELLKLKFLPKESPKGYKDQIEWYMNLENHIRGIIDVGKRDSELATEAFGRSKISTILNMFPTRIKSQLMKCPGQGKSRLEAILVSIKELRMEAQEFQTVKEIGTDSVSSSYASCQGSNGSRNSNLSNLSLQVYKPPRKDNNCRICLTLEAEGDTQDLYEDHLHNYATGCTRYIMMSVAERLRVASKAKLCLKCHDPEYVFKKFDKQHKCIGNSKRKGKFTCRSCSYHMWVCKRHPEDNKEFMHKFKEKYLNDYKLNLGLIVSSQVELYENSSEESVQKSSNLKVLNVSKSKRKRKKKPCSRSSDPCSPKGMSTIEATEALKKKFFDGGEAINLRPIPEGRAQFIIGQTKGLTRPLNTLYDTGCYGYLMKEGVQHELGSSVLKKKGPLHIRGVGNTAVVVNDEWQTSLPLRDGSRQVVEGFTVNQVTANLPIVDLSMAVKDVKADKPDDEKLQNLNVQMFAGGECDILLGLMYTSIFPIPVHSLENGLTIYELQVSSHNSEIDSLIGGPHSSFEYLANHMGGVNILFTQLVNQLEVYNQFGPPKIGSSLMSIEDLEYSNCKKWELGLSGGRFFDDYNDFYDENILDVDQSNESFYEEKVDDSSGQIIYTSVDQKCSCCDSLVDCSSVGFFVNDLKLDADEFSNKADLQCVGCDYSSSDPLAEVAKNCEVVSIAFNVGLKWHSKLDLLEVQVMPLPFSSNLRGRLQTETQLFESSFRDVHVKELRFLRAAMSDFAVLTEMDILLAENVCKDISNTGAWRRFKFKNGKYVGQLVVVDDKFHKIELVTMVITSNLGLTCQFLEKWFKSCINFEPTVSTSIWGMRYPWIDGNIDDAIIDALGILTSVRYLRLNYDDEENVSYMVLLNLRKVPKLWSLMNFQILFTEMGNSLDKASICYPKYFFSMASHQEAQFHSSKFTMKVFTNKNGNPASRCTVFDVQMFQAADECEERNLVVTVESITPVVDRISSAFKTCSPNVREERAYNYLFNFSNVTIISKLQKMKKFCDGNGSSVEDVIYFRKQKIDVSSTWFINGGTEAFNGRNGRGKRSTDCMARFLACKIDTIVTIVDEIGTHEETEEAVDIVSFILFALEQVGDVSELKFEAVAKVETDDNETNICHVKPQLDDSSMETTIAVQSFCCTPHNAVTDKHVKNAVEMNVPALGKDSRKLTFVDRDSQGFGEFETVNGYHTDGEVGDSSPC